MKLYFVFSELTHFIVPELWNASGQVGGGGGGGGESICRLEGAAEIKPRASRVMNMSDPILFTQWFLALVPVVTTLLCYRILHKIAYFLFLPISILLSQFLPPSPSLIHRWVIAYDVIINKLNFGGI